MLAPVLEQSRITSHASGGTFMHHVSYMREALLAEVRSDHETSLSQGFTALTPSPDTSHEDALDAHPALQKSAQASRWHCHTLRTSWAKRCSSPRPRRGRTALHFHRSRTYLQAFEYSPTAFPRARTPPALPQQPASSLGDLGIVGTPRQERVQHLERNQ